MGHAKRKRYPLIRSLDFEDYIVRTIGSEGLGLTLRTHFAWLSDVSEEVIEDADALRKGELEQKVRKLEERVWKEENQRGKHIPGYGGFLPQEENSPANDVMLPHYHAPDMEEWGGKTPKYCGHKPERPCHENPDYMWNLDHSRNNHYTTTYGQANQMTIETAARLKKRPPIVRPLWPHEDPNAKRGVKGFFYEDPKLESSEEGKKQAEKYFAIVRPLEGTLMAMNSNRSIKSAVMM